MDSALMELKFCLERQSIITNYRENVKFSSMVRVMKKKYMFLSKLTSEGHKLTQES